MKNYLKYLKPTQQQPIPGQNMVKNNAGGYSYTVTDYERLDRFLILGSDSGTYYVDEQTLTAQNADFIIDYIKRDPGKVWMCLQFCQRYKKAPRHNPLLFVYALYLTFADDESRANAYKWMGSVCYTPTHLFTLLTFLKPLRGWSRGLRTAVANWYKEKDIDSLSYQMVKYRSRSGYTHKDALRLCHAKTDDSKRNSLFKYAVDKAKPEDIELFPIIEGYELASLNAKDIPLLLHFIFKYGLTWEMLPTETLNQPLILTALLEDMPLTALLRNLNRYAYTGLTKDNNDVTQLICKKLTNSESISHDKIHPITVINTLMVYMKGHGDKGNKTWTANQQVLDALHEMYTLAMANVMPTYKNILIGVDTSGSMIQSTIGGMGLTPAQVAMVLSNTIQRTEPNVDVICFDTDLKPYPFGKRSSIDEILKYVPAGGGTDCSIPIGYAYRENKVYDAIIILTDNETWTGKQHSTQLLQIYRGSYGKNTKIIEVCMVATPCSNFKEDDRDCLRVVGFDATVLQVIRGFIGNKSKD